MMSTSKMTGSPSFHELFDENGHIRKCENAQQEDNAIIMQQSSSHISSSRSHDYEHETCVNVVNHTSAAIQTDTIHSAAPQSQSHCSSTTFNHMSSSINQQQLKQQVDGERPHSSYCKTRSALNSFSDTPSLQLNISPGSVPYDSDAHHLHSLLLQHNTATPITPPPTFHLQQNSHNPTSDTSASNNMNGLSLNSPSSDAFSPPITQQSSLFLTDGPPPPPAPQASNHQDVLNDDHGLDDPESFLSSLSLLHYNPYPSPQLSSTKNVPKNKHGNFHHRSHSTPPPRLLSSFSSKKKNQKSTSLFSSVPLDALHCIGRFLTVEEWLTLSLINSEALGVCREVMNKVRMHGFKCAVEVVSAWVSSF